MVSLTSTTRDGASTAINVYITFVQTAAASGHTASHPYSGLFRDIASTASVDARDNTSTTGTGVPVYWFNGAKAGENYGDLYDGSWDDEVYR